MESLTPSKISPAATQKVEIEASKETALETKLFLKTLDPQGTTSLPIGVWKDKKFTFSGDAKNVDLQQVAQQVLKNEGKCSSEEQVLLLKALIDRGVPLSSIDEAKRTPLHHAAASGNLELMRILIDQGHLDINARDGAGLTPLTLAIMAGKTETVKFLLENHADVSLTSDETYRMTPLHYAALQGNKEIVKLLLEAHADINVLNSEGKTPLYLCVEYTCPDLIPLLAAPETVNQPAANGKTPLILATDTNQVNAVESLLKHQADPSLPENTSGRSTPLHFAALQGNQEIVKLLLDARADPKALNSEGKSPLYFCIEYQHPELIPLLVTPETINQPANSGKTPLILAVDIGRKDSVESLLKYKPDPNIPDYFGSGMTALHYAVHWHQIDLAKLLLENGAKVSSPNAQGVQPLHYAVINQNSTDMLSLLIENGADLNAVVHDQTPLHLAESSGSEPLVRFLLEQGADPNKVFRLGTPLSRSTRTNPEALYPEETKLISAECTRRKKISLRFGIRGMSKVSKKADIAPELALEGYTRAGGVQVVTQRMKTVSFDGTPEGKLLIEDTWPIVTQAFNDAPIKGYSTQTAEEKSDTIGNYLKRLDTNQPIIVPTGWHGHATYMLFLKTPEGVLLVDCNRGERANIEEGGFTVYKMKDPGQPDGDTLDRLLTGTDRDFIEQFTAQQEKQEHVGMKDQKSGTCAFTSAKTAVFATIYTLFKQKGIDNQTSLALAKQYYRAWTQQDRAGDINDMLDEYEKNPASPFYQQDHNLLFSVLSKMKANLPMHPEYAIARERLIHFLEKNAPEPWTCDQEVDNTYRSPLTYAVHSKQKDLIRLMIKKGADINAVDPGYWTPLQRAITEGDKDMVSFLLKQGAKLEGSPGQDPPIHTAIKYNRMDIAAYLLKKMKKERIDLNLPDSAGVPLIHQAASISKDAVVFLENQGLDINARDQRSYTTLQCAIEAGQSGVVQYLIDQGMPLTNDPENERGLLQLAVFFGHVDLAKEIAQQMRQQDLSIMTPDRSKINFVTLAAHQRNIWLFDELPSFGISLSPEEKVECLETAIKRVSSPRRTPEDVAECVNFIAYLIDRQGVNLAAHDSDGDLAIEKALSQPDTPVEIIGYLIDRMAISGVNIYAPTKHGSIYEQVTASGRTQIAQYIDQRYPRPFTG
jgi:ankyrin repeat protein